MIATLILLALLGQAASQLTVNRDNKLAIRRDNPALATSNSIVFVAGGAETPTVERWNIDASTFVASANLTRARRNLIGLSFATTVLFVDSDTGEVERYNASTNSFFVLPVALIPPVAAVAVNNKAVFVHGPFGQLGRFYNVDTNAFFPADWQLCTSQCENRSTEIATARLGNRAFFAGGGPEGSRRVVIYDDTSETFISLPSALSAPRSGLRAVVARNKIFFAGGPINVLSGTPGNATEESIIDIFDGANDTFVSRNLQVPRSSFSFAATGNLVLFAGGLPDGAGQWTSYVEVLNADTLTFEPPTNLSSSRGEMTGLTISDYAVFAGGSDTNFDFSASSVVDVFLGPTLAQTLTSSFLTRFGSLVVDSRAFLAGGILRGGSSDAFDVILPAGGSACLATSDCRAAATSYTYVQCISGSCVCRNGFSGQAKAQSPCSCNGTVAYENQVPRCLSAGQCLPGRRDLCMAVSEDYNYVTCVQNNCTCLRGFTGSATLDDKCGCEGGRVVWEQNIPSCVRS